MYTSELNGNKSLYVEEFSDYKSICMSLHEFQFNKESACLVFLCDRLLCYWDWHRIHVSVFFGHFCRLFVRWPSHLWIRFLLLQPVRLRLDSTIRFWNYILTAYGSQSICIIHGSFVFIENIIFNGEISRINYETLFEFR